MRARGKYMLNLQENYYGLAGRLFCEGRPPFPTEILN